MASATYKWADLYGFFEGSLDDVKRVGHDLSLTVTEVTGTSLRFSGSEEAVALLKKRAESWPADLVE